MTNPYTQILLALADARVDFIVGGGVACVLHGVERVTMDVDLAVWMHPDNYQKFVQVMRDLGLQPRVPLAPEALLDPEVIRTLCEEKHALVFTFLDIDHPFRQVDLFLRPELRYESLSSEAETVMIKGRPIRLIGKRQMLAIKLGIQPPRAKDRLDIEALQHLVQEPPPADS